MCYPRSNFFSVSVKPVFGKVWLSWEANKNHKNVSFRRKTGGSTSRWTLDIVTMCIQSCIDIACPLRWRCASLTSLLSHNTVSKLYTWLSLSQTLISQRTFLNQRIHTMQNILSNVSVLISFLINQVQHGVTFKFQGKEPHHRLKILCNYSCSYRYSEQKRRRGQ